MKDIFGELLAFAVAAAVTVAVTSAYAEGWNGPRKYDIQHTQEDEVDPNGWFVALEVKAEGHTLDRPTLYDGKSFASKDECLDYLDVGGEWTVDEKFKAILDNYIRLEMREHRGQVTFGKLVCVHPSEDWDGEGV